MFKRMTQRDGKPAWNRDKLVGQKPPLKLKEIWATRVRLQMTERWRDLALFNLAIDSKPRACDLVELRVQAAVSAAAFERTADAQFRSVKVFPYGQLRPITAVQLDFAC